MNLILAVVLGHSDMPNDLEMTYGVGTLETNVANDGALLALQVHSVSNAQMCAVL